MKPRICPICLREFSINEVRNIKFQRKLDSEGCPNCSSHLDLSLHGFLPRNMGILPLILFRIYQEVCGINNLYILFAVLIFTFFLVLFYYSKACISN